ncbi:hypothetical protein Q7P37_010532 [Cladosporium fusiforme]
MPAVIEDDMSDTTESGVSTLPFPPVTKAHIMNCSYHSWHPKYRTVTPKARLIPLSQPFLDYLRADGIILPDDDEPSDEPEWSDDSGVFSSSEARENGQDDGDDDEQGDVAAGWRDIHAAVQETISTLGGRVMPKLNWSSPKDATWMNANSMDCRTPNDIYLLLKSSDFVTHDLEYAFDDTEPGQGPEATLTTETIPYHLVLRKAFEMNPSVEFRCFVRNRKLIGLCQRDLNHFDFLFELQDRLQSKIQEFFDVRLRDTFPDENFAFDVYVPTPYERVWLVDVNPWAPRTDPLLFSWLELLTMDEPPEQPQEEEQTVRIPIRFGSSNGEASGAADAKEGAQDIQSIIADAARSSDSDSESDVDEEIWKPEFRLIRKSDPEAYSFSTPQYSAHKMPKDVVDAGASGGGSARVRARLARDFGEEAATRC